MCLWFLVAESKSYLCVLLVFYMYIFKSVIYCALHVNVNISAMAVFHVKLYLYEPYLCYNKKHFWIENWMNWTNLFTSSKLNSTPPIGAPKATETPAAAAAEST